MTGLAAAYHLVNKGYEVALHEAGSQLGGQVRTIKIGGSDVEIFYHHLFRSDVVITDLIAKLGLESDLQWLPSVGAIHSEGKIYPFVGPIDLLRFTKVSLIARVRLGLAAMWLRYYSGWRKYEGVRASTWIKKTVGEAAYSAVWRPLLKSKFGSRFQDVSMTWFWGKVHLRFASRDGIFAKEKLGYLTGSFRRYIDLMSENIHNQGGTLITSSKVKSVLTDNEQVTGFKYTIDGEEYEENCDVILATTPSHIFKEIVPESVNNSKYGELLDSIEYQWASVLFLVLDRPLTDIYWLTMTDDDMPFVAVVEQTNLIDSSVYGGNHIVYFSNYADPDDAMMRLGVDDIFDVYEPYIKRINPDFDRAWVREKHFFTDRAGQPVVDYLYHERLVPHQTPLKGLYLANNTQIYPEDRGQNYSIRMGFRVADLIAINGTE